MKHALAIFCALIVSKQAFAQLDYSKFTGIFSIPKTLDPRCNRYDNGDAFAVLTANADGHYVEVRSNIKPQPPTTNDSNELYGFMDIDQGSQGSCRNPWGGDTGNKMIDTTTGVGTLIHQETKSYDDTGGVFSCGKYVSTSIYELEVTDSELIYRQNDQMEGTFECHLPRVR